jgi:hypothetical protein
MGDWENWSCVQLIRHDPCQDATTQFRNKNCSGHWYQKDGRLLVPNEIRATDGFVTAAHPLEAGLVADGRKAVHPDSGCEVAEEGAQWLEFQYGGAIHHQPGAFAGPIRVDTP